MHFLSNIEIFNNVGDAVLSDIVKNARDICCAKGKILFLKGDEAKHFYYVRKGWVKLFRETLDGTQAVVDIVPRGHIFAETSIFEEDGVYPYSAEVVETSDIVALSLAQLKSNIEGNNVLALNMLKTMARYRQQQEREIEHRSIQNAAQRIGCFLLRMVDQSAQGSLEIHLPYDKTLLASRLGMQPETFSRALAKLREKTGITVHGATIRMDEISQLSEYSCMACSSEFPCHDLSYGHKDE